MDLLPRLFSLPYRSEKKRSVGCHVPFADYSQLQKFCQTSVIAVMSKLCDFQRQRVVPVA